MAKRRVKNSLNFFLVKNGFFAEPCAVKSAKSQISQNPSDFIREGPVIFFCKITDFVNFCEMQKQAFLEFLKTQIFLKIFMKKPEFFIGVSLYVTM